LLFLFYEDASHDHFFYSLIPYYPLFQSFQWLKSHPDTWRPGRYLPLRAAGSGSAGSLFF